MQLSRPDKIRVRRTGGYADVELIYDGKTLTFSGNNVGAYVQEDMSGSIDQMFDAVQAKLQGLFVVNIDDHTAFTFVFSAKRLILSPT